MSTLLRHVLGWGLLVLGFLGLFLPVLQGILFIAIGAVLLSPDVPFFHRLSLRLEQRYPGLGQHLRRWRARLARPVRLPHRRAGRQEAHGSDEPGPGPGDDEQAAGRDHARPPDE